MPANISTSIERPNMPSIGGPTWVEITVEPGSQTREVQRQIILVLDRSGSMSGTKIDQAKRGAKWVFGLLEDDDYIGLISFDSSVNVDFAATQYGNTDQNEAQNQVDALSAGGGTNIFNALEKAKNQLAGLPDNENTARRILLLTDGKDNQYGPSDFKSQAQDIDNQGVRIMSAGIGNDYNQDTVRTLGEASRGNWIHLTDASDIQDFFANKLAEASTVVASDAQLELDVTSGVEVTEVYRRAIQAQEVDVEWDANTATVKLPDLLDHQQQTVNLRMIAPERDIEENVVLANVTLQAAGEFAEDTIQVQYTADQDLQSVRNEDVWAKSKKTKIQTQVGRNDIEAAETELETVTAATNDQTIVDDIEDTVTKVKEGGREEQYESTIVNEEENIG